MNPYADLFTLFERSGVKDRQSLETLLGRFPSGYYPSPGQIADDPALLCDSFCCRLMDRSTFCDEVRIAGGIRQFSLNVRPRIPDDSVRKGLFLSSIATIFTSHELTYRMASYQNYYDGSSSVSFSRIWI